MKKVGLVALLGLALICVVPPADADRDKHRHSEFSHREHYRADRHHYYPNHYRNQRHYYRGGNHHRGRHHHYHHGRHYYHGPHYRNRVVVYHEHDDDYYKWIGGAILAGEILHHTWD